MNPRLVAIAGPLEGAIFPFAAKELWIGRDPTNHLCLSDPLVSRKHCVIQRDAHTFRLRDANSSNGTLVNDVPVRERELAEGDCLKIGDSSFLFLLEELEPVQPSLQLPLDDRSVVARTTFVLKPEEAIYLQPEKISALPANERTKRDLNALLTLSTELGKLRRLGEIQHKLLALIFEVIPAERGVILLSKERFPQAGRFVWRDRLGRTEPPKVSQTVVRRVMQEGVSILSNDVGEDPALAQVPSLVISSTRSLLVVPLALHEQVLGAIYLDAKEDQVVFDEDHLQLLAASAGVAAIALDNAGQFEWLEGEARRLNHEINYEHDIIGESAPMQAVYQLVRRVAASDSNILILGESGTGKELAARAIHRHSPRADKPFVAINCAGLNDTLLESDLFGHEKGAFTGAVAQKKGKLELAHGGTVLLDELGEMPLYLQAKLLRVLQFREFERLGGTRSIKTDIRLVAATNRNLENLMAAGSFRADLYYRLNVVSLTMPPLRERRDDIPLLAHYFAVKYGRKCKRPIKGLDAATRTLLLNYDWPGNVRELENVIERAVVLGSTELLLPDDLPEALHEAALPNDTLPTQYHGAIREAKIQQVLQALEQTEGHITKAAGLLGLHPNNLHRLIRNLGIRPLLKKRRTADKPGGEE